MPRKHIRLVRFKSYSWFVPLCDFILLNDFYNWRCFKQSKVKQVSLNISEWFRQSGACQQFSSARVLLVLRSCCYFSPDHRQVTTMAAIAPAEIYSLNLGLSEIGNKIYQIQQQLDKTEDLVNNLSQLKLNQAASVMLERQVGDDMVSSLHTSLWHIIMWSNTNSY